MTKFTLEIEVGNDAVQDAADIADALREVAKHVADSGRPGDTGKILDANGNTVGTWGLS